jgi:fumarate hydratase subunit beta
MKKIRTPITDDVIKDLVCGEQVLLSGTIYTARDAAHKQMLEDLADHNPLPFDINGQIIFYLGPCPAAPGEVIGPAGPTTSHRMDKYTPKLLDLGLKGMIGKGNRTSPVIDSIRKNSAVYFACVGGTGTLCARHIQHSEIIAYPELGTEAVRKLEVKDFPIFVAIDAKGNNIYDNGPKLFRKYIIDNQINGGTYE